MANRAIIGLESWTGTSARAREIARRFDAGEPVEVADYHLNFASAAQLFSELTPARLTLLDILKRGGPLSVYALAKQARRNYSNVHRDIRALLQHELVAKDKQGRVFVPWDEVILNLALAARTAEPRVAAVTKN